jgi:RNA polymerase sigma factor (sigma-70 family)
VSAPYDADLELARQCAAGNETAWERFVLDYRPILYRAADALDPTGRARELADSLYADLYGKSLFRYFQGRSSLATWLRAVLAQRYVDYLRADRRMVALPDEDAQGPAEAGHYQSAAGHYPSGAGPYQSAAHYQSAAGHYQSGARHHESEGGRYQSGAASGPTPDSDRARYLTLMQNALSHAIAGLDAKDRLRLACYYAQDLTLAETGRVLKEHEATASRQLARTRRAIREQVERQLRDQAKLDESEISQCFASVSDDAGPIDLDGMLAAAAGRKETAPDRSSS